jgi:hypothetical protein
MHFAGMWRRMSTHHEGERIMKFLVISTNTKDSSPFLEAEVARIQELRKAGTITDGWVKADFSGAILQLECADADEAISALNTLPMVINDATNFELVHVLGFDEAAAGM